MREIRTARAARQAFASARRPDESGAISVDVRLLPQAELAADLNGLVIVSALTARGECSVSAANVVAAFELADA